MIYCFTLGMIFDYIDDEIELLYGRDKKSCIFYDISKDIFLDYDDNEIDISGMKIFPRTGVNQIYELNNSIIRHGGTPILANEYIERIFSWPLYYQTKRKTITLYGTDLINESMIFYIEYNFGKEIFLKTKDKNFSAIISTDLLKDKECALYKALIHHLKDTFFVSEKVNIAKDKYGLMEYRCVVRNNKVYNISRMTTSVVHKIEKELLEKAMSIIEQMKGIFPTDYVVDLFFYETENGLELDVVEFNSIHASGIYLYNSVIDKSNDLLHDDLYNVAEEFKNKNNLIENGKMIDERENCYDNPNSFANDLCSICLAGEVGLTYTTFKLKDEHFALHEPILNPKTMTRIESDDDFFSDEEKDKDKDKEDYDLSDDVMKEIRRLVKERKDN